jgi:matrixin
MANTAVAADASRAIVPPREAGDPPYRLLVLDGRAVRWGLPSDKRPVRVSYAFLDKPTTYGAARNCDSMLPVAAALEPSRVAFSRFREEVREAFRIWHEAINIDFHEVSDAATANIVIGAEGQPRGRAFTNVATRNDGESGIGRISQSLICLNPTTRWKIGFDGDLDVYDLRYTISHEIGHAIGLDHPGAEGQLM